MPRGAVLAIALASALVVAVVLSLVIYFTANGDNGGSGESEPPIPLEGESLYIGQLIAYPRMEEKDILYISVENSKGSFGMVRPDDNGDFEFFYKDEKGNIKNYRPNIADVDDNFEYSDLYAYEDNGYGKITRLTYLCMALQLPYFEERIALIPEERDAQLKAYGLSEGEYETVSFTYKKLVVDGEGNPILDDKGNKTYEEAKHTIKIGDPTTLENGYYFMVDGRDYVYAGYSSYFDYALMGFYSFVNSILVSPALGEDGVLSGFFTSNYYQWLGEMHKTEGENVAADSKVVSFADVIVPMKWSDKLTEDSQKPQNGYFHSGYETTTFNLYKYKDNENYERLVSALLGASVGSYEGNDIIATVVNPTLIIDFAGAESVLYSYEITAIESVLGKSAEYTAVGTPVGDNKLVKVSYKLKINGKPVNEEALHAVIDLEEKGLPAEFTARLKAASVGTLDAGSTIKLDMTYTKENAVQNRLNYVVTAILGIYDPKGNEISEVKENSIVSYRYRISINGEYYDGEEYTTIVSLAEDISESGLNLKEALLGRKVGSGLEIKVDEYTEYCEYFMDFMCFSVSRIDYFVKRQMISAFRFQNRSERDPYYGESIYENTLENKYAIYGISNSVCQQVVNILTGLQKDTTSAPGGLIGAAVVEVGITPELMEKYGLYKNEIYFEVPRGVITISNPDAPNDIDDYIWYETLGFTLYISDEQPDGTRFIASDMYDIIAVVGGENFVFLNYDFVNFWARREMMLTDMAYMQDIKVEFNLEDMKGMYDMKLTHTEVWWSADKKRYTSRPPDTDKVSYTYHDEVRVDVYPMGECTPNKLTEAVAENNGVFVSLTQFYNEIKGNGKQNMVGFDHLGTSHFYELFQGVYSTHYDGIIPAEEQGAILSESDMLMRIAYSLGPKVSEDGYGGSNISAYSYVYEYYRYSDNRVMVRIYQARYDAESGEYIEMTTPVSDFYITNFAFKKIVGHFKDLFGGNGVNQENSYN